MLEVNTENETPSEKIRTYALSPQEKEERTFACEEERRQESNVVFFIRDVRQEEQEGKEGQE